MPANAHLLYEAAARPPHALTDGGIPTVCKRDGCENFIEQTGVGRPRVFCGDECRLAFWNASVRGPASPTHKIADFDDETGMGVCAICGPVRVYVIADKHKDGRPRRRLTCSVHALKGPARKSRQRYLRSVKRQVGRYGLTVAQFDALVIGQAGRCGKCSVELVQMQVDHEHGRQRAVRGLLCVNCNTGIGKLGDDEEGLLEALEYLRNPPARWLCGE